MHNVQVGIHLYMISRSFAHNFCFVLFGKGSDIMCSAALLYIKENNFP